MARGGLECTRPSCVAWPCMCGVGDLADQEGLGQRMAWGAALATQCLGEGAGSPTTRHAKS